MSGGRSLLYTNVRAGHDAALEKTSESLRFRGFPLAAGEGFELPRRDVICCPLLLNNPRNARMIGRFQSSDYYDILACVSQSRRGKGMNKDMNVYLIIFEEIC